MNPIKKIKYLYSYKNNINSLKEGKRYDLPSFDMVDLQEEEPQKTGQTKPPVQNKPQQNVQQKPKQQTKPNVSNKQQLKKQVNKNIQQKPVKNTVTNQTSNHSNEKIKKMIQSIEQVKTNLEKKFSDLDNKFEVTNQNIVSLKDMLYNPEKKRKEDMENRVNKGYSTVRDFYKEQKKELQQDVDRFDYSNFNEYDKSEAENDFFGNLRYDF